MLAYQQKESTARVASIMENTNLSKQQQVSEIMRQMLTQAQTAGQYFTNDQIKEMTRKVSAEVDLVHQQTQNQRYGSSHIGATAKDISNVVTDAASGVVDIFQDRKSVSAGMTRPISYAVFCLKKKKKKKKEETTKGQAKKTRMSEESTYHSDGVGEYE